MSKEESSTKLAQKTNHVFSRDLSKNKELQKEFILIQTLMIFLKMKMEILAAWT